MTSDLHSHKKISIFATLLQYLFRLSKNSNAKAKHNPNKKL